MIDRLLLRVVFYLCLEISFFKRRIFIKQWGNEFGINIHHHKHDETNKSKCIKIKILKRIDCPNNSRYNKSIDRSPHNEFLYGIFDIKAKRHFIKTMSLFENKC